MEVLMRAASRLQCSVDLEISGWPKCRGICDLAFVLICLMVSFGCAGVGNYGEDRLRDLSDVVDVRYGYGFGLGASAQFSTLFETGLGCSSEAYMRQWFGRKSTEVRDGVFAHGLIFGFDGDYHRRLNGNDWLVEGDASTGSFDILIFNMNYGPSEERLGSEEWFDSPAGDPPRLTRARFGGAVFLPGINFGFYANAGEIVDLICGLVNYDLMRDDGVPKFRLSGAESN